MSVASQKALIVSLTAEDSLGKPGESTFEWASKEDKAWFRSITRSIGNIVMGRKTYSTVEHQQPLPERMNYILTRSPEKISPIENSLQAVTLEQFKALKLSRFCVIGGGEVYKEMWHMVEVLYISHHKDVFVGGPSEHFDMSRAVLFAKREWDNYVQEIYTQPSFVHPQITLTYEDNEFMDAAEKYAREHSLDKNHPTGAVLVKDGKIIGYSANGSHWHEEHSNDPVLKDFGGCERKRQGCPSGTGYDLCEGCSNDNHAERRLIKQTKAAGYDTNGATCYLWGHWWYCEPCAQALLSGGVKKVVASRKWTTEFLGICNKARYI